MNGEKLALLGGEPCVKKTLEELSAKLVPAKAYETISGMLDRGEISGSPLVGKFEKRFAEYIGVKYGNCVVNGTTAIQEALFAVGVKTGDEVIVPSYTFWATVGPVIANGAFPVFVDVDRDTHNLSPEAIEKAITPKTKAILLVHVWGNPCDMDGIMAIARKYDLKVIEDCSHAHGATYKGKKVGSIGDVGCFSMQGSKVLAAGEGGILVTDNKEYYERAQVLGRYECCTKMGSDSDYARYSLTGFGYKHRMNPLAAAIADANLDRMDELNEIRNRNARRFEELLADLPFVRFQKEVEGAEKVFAYHYAEYIPELNGGVKYSTFLSALAKEGVACGFCVYGKLHLSPLYTKDGPLAKEYPFNLPNFPQIGKENLPNTKILGENSFLAAPRFEEATEEDIEQYAKAYHKVAANVQALLEYEKGVQEKEMKGATSINYVR